MRRSTKITIQYMVFVWLFTTVLAFIVGCSGKDGKDGVTTAEVVAVIHPCGTFDGIEFRIVKLSNDKVISHYNDGKKTRTTELRPGKYHVILNDTCEFEIKADKSVESEYLSKTST